MDDHSKTTVWVVALIVIALILVGLVVARRRKGVYTGGADSQKRIMLPAGKGPHTHLVDLDASGFGISTEDMGHRHVVEDSMDVGVEDKGQTVPADHSHNLGEFIVDVEEE